MEKTPTPPPAPDAGPADLHHTIHFDSDLIIRSILSSEYRPSHFYHGNIEIRKNGSGLIYWYGFRPSIGDRVMVDKIGRPVGFSTQSYAPKKPDAFCGAAVPKTPAVFGGPAVPKRTEKRAAVADTDTSRGDEKIFDRFSMRNGIRIYYDDDYFVVLVENPAERRDNERSFDLACKNNWIFIPYAFTNDNNLSAAVGDMVELRTVRDKNGNPHRSLKILKNPRRDPASTESMRVSGARRIPISSEAQKEKERMIDSNVRKATFFIRNVLNEVDADFEVDNSPAAVDDRVDRLVKVLVRDFESLHSAVLVLRHAKENGEGWHRVLRDQEKRGE